MTNRARHLAPRSWLMILLALALGGPAGAKAQSLHGRVVDGSTGAPVNTVEVVAMYGSKVAASVLSDSAGAFRMLLPTAGSYELAIKRLGYHAEPVTVAVGATELVEVTLRISATAVPLEAITIRARRFDPRHTATYEGFHLRRESLPPIGNRRAILRTDGEMANAARLADVLLWLPKRSCTIFYLNGRMVGRNSVTILVEDLSMSLLEGLEFYRYGDEAPLEMRGAYHCAPAATYSVIALWMERSDLPVPN